MLRNIFIDLDDTLWDTYSNNKMCLAKLYDKYNWARYFDSFEAFFSDYMPHNDLLWERYRSGTIEKKELIVGRFAHPFRSLASPPSREEILKLNEEFLALSKEQTTLVEGAMELMDILKERGYRIMLISNGFKEVQERKLAASGLASYFEALFISETLGVHKPNPLFFHHALSASESRKEETVVVGDSLGADIAGAAAADLPAIWFNPYGLPFDQTIPRRPAAIVKQLAEIPGVLDTIC